MQAMGSARTAERNFGRLSDTHLNLAKPLPNLTDYLVDLMNCEAMRFLLKFFPPLTEKSTFDRAPLRAGNLLDDLLDDRLEFRRWQRSALLDSNSARHRLVLRRKLSRPRLASTDQTKEAARGVGGFDRLSDQQGWSER